MQAIRVRGMLLGVALVGALFTLAVPAERAQAASLINPGAAQMVQDAAQPVTEVHWRGHGWHHRHWRWHRWHHRYW